MKKTILSLGKALDRADQKTITGGAKEIIGIPRANAFCMSREACRATCPGVCNVCPDEIDIANKKALFRCGDMAM